MGVSNIKWSKPIDQLIRQDILGKDTMEFAAIKAELIMNPFVPMDTGKLANYSLKIFAGEKWAEIHYNVPYAADVYYNKRGVKFKKEKHPLATSLWDKRAMEAGGKEKLAGAVQEYINRKKGGT